MHSSRLVTLLALFVTTALATGCADGDDGGNSSFGSSVPNPTGQPTTPPVMGTTSDGNSEAGVTEADPSAEETTDDPPLTGSSDPSTTAVDPSTTAPDPSTTAPDPSTTAPMTTMTTDPPNADQPTNGKLYAECLEGGDCVSPNACLTVTDNMTMMVYDGYCTRECATVNDCGVAPAVPAVQKCVPFDVGLSLCMLECFDSSDCPNGMECTGVTNPNMMSGNYCI